MSNLIFTLPVKLGHDDIQASIYEQVEENETSYILSIPSLGSDKLYQLFLEPYGDVHFCFREDVPYEIKLYEEVISKAIYNYYI